MFTSVQDALIQWYKSTDDRTKLQHSYLTIALATLIVAGTSGLFNYQLGQLLLQVVYGLLVVFLINAIVWALLESFAFTRLNTKARRQTKK